MELYLMRHGIAEDGEPGSPDSARRLTEEGKVKAAGVLKLAKKAGVQPDLILSSPYVRAMETAQIAKDVLGVAGEIVELPALVPHGTPENVWRDIRDYGDYSTILLAGHEPLMGHLAGYLLNAPSLVVEVKKASVIRIDFAGTGPSPRGVLRWMLVSAMVE